MSGLRVVHTADLGAGGLEALRQLLDEAFAGDFGDDDWEHSLGGLHVVVEEGGAPVAHASVVQRRLLHGGRALRCGYVEGVGVRPDRRRRGHGTALMAEVGRVVRAAYDLGALGATDEAEPLYAAHGWQRWRGTTSVVAPGGLRRTPDEDGSVWVLPVAAPLDLGGDLACDWRGGDVW